VLDPGSAGDVGDEPSLPRLPANPAHHPALYAEDPVHVHPVDCGFGGWAIIRVGLYDVGSQSRKRLRLLALWIARDGVHLPTALKEFESARPAPGTPGSVTGSSAGSSPTPHRAAPTDKPSHGGPGAEAGTLLEDRSMGFEKP